MPMSVTVTLRSPAQAVTYTLPSGMTETTARDLLVHVYAPNAPGRYPVIVYSHGHGDSAYPAAGAGLMAQALADLGYIVIAPNHLDSIANYPQWLRSQFTVFSEAAGLHRIADLQFALTQAPTLAGRLPPGYSADLTAPVIAGHSNGAYSAQVLVGLTTGAASHDLQPGNPYGLNQVTDARFAAAVLISPQGQDTSWTRLQSTAWNAITVPTLIITGTRDDEPLGGPGRWPGRLDLMRNGDNAGATALVFRDAGHDDIGGISDIPGLTGSITGAIDSWLDVWRAGGSGSGGAWSDATGLLASDPLLAQVFVRASVGATPQGALAGTAGADVLTALASDDWITAGAGDDLITGGEGSDRIEGGAGWDTATYSSGRASYRLWTDGVTWYVKGRDGSDRLTGVEALRFTDGEVTLGREVCFFSPKQTGAPGVAEAASINAVTDLWTPSTDWLI